MLLHEMGLACQSSRQRLKLEQLWGVLGGKKETFAVWDVFLNRTQALTSAGGYSICAPVTQIDLHCPSKEAFPEIHLRGISRGSQP